MVGCRTKAKRYVACEAIAKGWNWIAATIAVVDCCGNEIVSARDETIKGHC